MGAKEKAFPRLWQEKILLLFHPCYGNLVLTISEGLLEEPCGNLQPAINECVCPQGLGQGDGSFI